MQIIPYKPGDLIVLNIPGHPPIMLHQIRKGAMGCEIPEGAMVRRIHRPVPLTASMRWVVANLSEGKSHDDHCHDRAQHAGILGTVNAMLKRGLIKFGGPHKYELTADGVAAAAAAKAVSA